MKIREILRDNCIKAQLESENKPQVIKELSRMMAQSYAEIDVANLEEILSERERLGSTGIGNGVAILHGKLANLKHIATGFGRSVQGISFDAQDGEQVHLFFVLIAPKNSASLHLKAMARLSRLLKDAHFRNRLYEADTAAKIYEIIVGEDEKF
jgi:PTS system nitrogen regulatory IIA component